MPSAGNLGAGIIDTSKISASAVTAEKIRTTCHHQQVTTAR